jgi:serine/threonine protein kinase
VSNNSGSVVKCYGLTKNPSDGNYMLVMYHMDINLRSYLQQNHNKLTWKERINFTLDIIDTLSYIHEENAIHRDLHSGNILIQRIDQLFRVSDLGFCGPADKPLNCIYGNLPYIAPEVITGKETTKASDIYSIGILMWEISSGQPPFINQHNYDLAIKIINGMRPKVIPGTPLEYKELMEQCWDADPTKRPDIDALSDKFVEMRRLIYQNEEQKINTNININSSQFDAIYSISSSSSSSSINSFFDSSSSRIYNFKKLKNLLPRNATKGKYY